MSTPTLGAESVLARCVSAEVRARIAADKCAAEDDEQRTELRAA